MDLSFQLDENIKTLQDIFKDDNTFKFRVLRAKSHVRCAIFFIDGMVDNELVNHYILLASQTIGSGEGMTITGFKEEVLSANEALESVDLYELIGSLLYGSTVFLMDGSNKGLALGTKGFMLRSISEPMNESMLYGAHEGFIESILSNTALIRRRIQTEKLKFKFMSTGDVTKTKVCIAYLDGRADENVLAELQKRLSEIQTDAILDANHIKELIKRDGITPFETIGYSERPDTVSARLLEGKIAVMVDGSPIVLTLPYFFIDNFQLTDDYNFNFYFSSFSRILRMLSFVFTVTFPAFYISLVAFHQEMIPTPLLYSISEARRGIPFPSVIEAIVLILIFELLREAGLRIPSNVGQALSIVGGIVIGQAAVEARLISAPLVIIIAFTGLTGLMSPKMKGIVIVARFAFLFLASIAGLYGLLFGVCTAIVHLCAQNTFGLSYVLYSSPLNKSSSGDNLIRVPWQYHSQHKLLPAFQKGEKKDEKNC